MIIHTQANRSKTRQNIRKRRQGLSIDMQQQHSITLLNRLSANIRVKHAKNIAIYLPNDGELNTLPFIHWCWQQGKQVYLPVIHPFSKGHLLFLRYTAQTTLVKNKYGINEPKLDVGNIISVHSLDILFTPLVAFDKYGNRLGMGGGFYDRTLAFWYKDYQINKKTTPYPIGLAHNCQQVENLPSEHWDIPLPEIVTPAQHYIFY